MAEEGYKQLISYKLAKIAFILGWEFIPLYFTKYEDGRQRDQIKQALRSLKQNIVEGSSERSLSTKLKLYDVAKSSGMEAREDFDDILALEHLPTWNKNDPRLYKLRKIFEGFGSNFSDPSHLPIPSVFLVIKEIEGSERKEKLDKKGVEIISNYLVDLLIRSGYFLDKQMNSLEKKHQTEGGYSENLLKKRLDYRRNTKN